jgi:geranylgeranyl diphosphate synthase type I
MVGGGSVEQIEHLSGFGRDLGLAFQLVDDLLGIWGHPVATGKPAHSDLQNRKKSLPVVAALTSGSAAGAELASLYFREEPLGEFDLARAAELIDEAGGRTWSRTKADELVKGALDRLASARPTPRAGAELGSLARMATRRNR